ncbi:MAG: HAD family hydrolase [Thermomicrobiales bacterium]
MDGSAITFDFHDTLAHCDRWFQLEVRLLVSEYLRWQAAAAGLPFDEAQAEVADAAYRQLRLDIMDHGREETAERCVSLVLDELGLPVVGENIDIGVESLMRDALEDLNPTHGAIETIHALADAGVPLGIVSSAVYHPFLLWTLDRFGIGDAFRHVTTSASAGFYKSRPEIFWDATTKLGAIPERTVHIGDSAKWDVGGARRAGLRPIWLRRNPDTPNDTGITPELTVSTLEGAAPAILAVLRSVRST